MSTTGYRTSPSGLTKDQYEPILQDCCAEAKWINAEERQDINLTKREDVTESSQKKRDS